MSLNYHTFTKLKLTQLNKFNARFLLQILHLSTDYKYILLLKSTGKLLEFIVKESVFCLSSSSDAPV